LSREILGNSRMVENWGKYIDIIIYFTNLCTFKELKKRVTNTEKLLLEKSEKCINYAEIHLIFDLTIFLEDNILQIK
jgi:hypothetical protein